MCTLEKNGNFFILTLTGSSDKDEHRLTIPVLNSILSAVSQVKAQATTGSVLITTSTGKFFSNGFDFAWARASGSETGTLERMYRITQLFKSITAQLMSLPMPTIAAVNGHAAAGGFCLALCHDYVMMRRDRGFVYMSEVDLGLLFPYYVLALFRGKLGSAQALRDTILRGAKMTGEEAVRKGVVDWLADGDGEEKVGEASMRLAQQLASRKWNGQVYADTRMSLYPDLCHALGLVRKTDAPISKL